MRITISLSLLALLSPSCLAFRPAALFTSRNSILPRTTSLFSEPERVDINGAPTESVSGEMDLSLEPGSHDELMYALGVNLARQLGDIRPLVESGEELQNLARGVLDVVVGKLPEKDQGVLLMSRKEDINALLVERSGRLQKRLEDSGRAMLEQMKETEGAIEVDNGVIVHLLEAGEDGDAGVRPTLSSAVKVHYHGTLPDGSVFDSSLGGDPVQFALGQVIPGWRVGLLKMHEGDTAMLGIPPEAGYGAEGSKDGRIPGGATLFFKVQLLEVLSAGIGGAPKLLGVDGNAMKKGDTGGGLLGVDGKPL
mmetsp:Transcript_41078/g.60298  ORF Transcript_41078/g.60298 Transcript_41078/m.60298 type:complete len:309 (+) Transcript_41078:26-952(+)|eukprot:CAMPEP_0195527436 /NCGR_PEP_ID=MMETSP0794_2-20130614/29110_1 /TAXON_ID=515487 /ORGANISM="Stephanopyxis turris, Strain CCMP 815" /LENGTH=308 /DNA_ID=CAMNT_0040658337 /DNA_START=25 /DNA_END=951 /DNA_ORIENTATION=+